MTGAQRFPDWEQLNKAVPDIAAPVRRYLQQLAHILRPGSVGGADQALRSLAAFLAERAPDVRFVADIRRHHIEDFRTWLAARPEYHFVSNKIVTRTWSEMCVVVDLIVGPALVVTALAN